MDFGPNGAADANRMYSSVPDFGSAQQFAVPIVAQRPVQTMRCSDQHASSTSKHSRHSGFVLPAVQPRQPVGSDDVLTSCYI